MKNPASTDMLDGADSEVAIGDDGIDSRNDANVPKPSEHPVGPARGAKQKAKAGAAAAKSEADAIKTAKAKEKAAEAATAKAERDAEKAARVAAKAAEAAAKAGKKAQADAAADAATKAKVEAGAAAGSDRKAKLAQLNAIYQVVNDAGRVRVMTFDAVVQTVGKASFTRYVPSFLSFADFGNLLQNQTVILSTGKDAAMGDWWLHHPERLTFDGLIFRPNAGRVIDGRLNLWRGWGVQPAPGSWDKMNDHIRIVMCAGDDLMYAYAIRWLAWTVQHPAEQAEVALVFRGGKGTGKGTLGSVMCQIFGGHAIHISNAKHLTGFNAHMRDACFMFADEAYWPGDKKAEGDLKRLVTESTLFIEAKRQDAISAKNMLHILMASNEDWIVPATEGERRWVVNEVSNCHQRDASWFDPIFKQMAEGGTAAMLHHLLKYDLGDWHPRMIPANAGLHDQQMRSLSPLDSWWFELLELGSLSGCDPDEPNRARSGDYDMKVTAEYEEHGRWVKKPGLYSQARQIEPRLRNYVSEHALGDYLRKAGCDNSKRVCRKTGWTFPELSYCRAAWEKRFPGTVWRNPGITEWRREDQGDDMRSPRDRRDDAYADMVKAEKRMNDAEAEVVKNPMPSTRF